MNMPQAYCAHSIVAHTKIDETNGAVSDIWSCCNCGMRFMPDANLPKFTPEPLFLKQREQSLKLWMLLDDIDTAGDMTKGNDVLYRSLCQNIQAKRWAIMSAKEVDDAIRARGDE